MSTQTNHRFSVSEYYRMGEIGLLAPDLQTELLDGQVVDSFRITPLHAAVTRRLAKIFLKLQEESSIVSVRNPVRIDEYHELQPDVTLLKYISNYYKLEHPRPTDVLLLVEISDRSLEFDRAKKLPVYARSGIPELWIVNLQESTIEIYREPHFTGYEKKIILRAGDKAAPSAFPDMIIDVAELLRR